MKPPHASDLYQYLLNPHKFSRHLYKLDPTVSCGLTGIDGSTTLGAYIAGDLKDRIGAKGSVCVSDWVTSWHPWGESQYMVWAVNPRWVRVFNKSLRYLSGGEPEVKIMPYTALSRLGAALNCHFPESPFWGADVRWPCYTEGVDDPADRPYGLTHELSGYKLEKVVEVCHEKTRYVVMPFKLGLIEKFISFEVPEYFPLHFGFKDRINSTVQHIKNTEAWGKDISKLILSFEHGQKLAIPNQGGIQMGESTYDNIPF